MASAGPVLPRPHRQYAVGLVNREQCVCVRLFSIALLRLVVLALTSQPAICGKILLSWPTLMISQIFVNSPGGSLSQPETLCSSTAFVVRC